MRILGYHIEVISIFSRYFLVLNRTKIKLQVLVITLSSGFRNKGNLRHITDVLYTLC